MPQPWPVPAAKVPPPVAPAAPTPPEPGSGAVTTVASATEEEARQAVAARDWPRAAGMGDQVAAGGVPEEYEEKIKGMRLELPTLVIWGERDPALLLGLTRGLEEWIPEMRLRVLPGAGHWVPYERPTEVNSLIREFVDGPDEEET